MTTAVLEARSPFANADLELALAARGPAEFRAARGMNHGRDGGDPARGARSCRMAEIRVVPADGGWSVEASFTEGALMFLSGARAESTAQRLAAAAAAFGAEVLLEIWTRDGRLASQRRYGHSIRLVTHASS